MKQKSIKRQRRKINNPYKFNGYAQLGYFDISRSMFQVVTHRNVAARKEAYEQSKRQSTED